MKIITGAVITSTTIFAGTLGAGAALATIVRDVLLPSQISAQLNADDSELVSLTQ